MSIRAEITDKGNDQLFSKVTSGLQMHKRYVQRCENS